MVLDQKVAGVADEARGLGDFLQRGDRRPKDMKHREGDLALLGRFDEADIIERLQGRRQQAGADIDHRDFGIGAAKRVEDLHLIGDLRDVDNFGPCRDGSGAACRAAPRCRRHASASDARRNNRARCGRRWSCRLRPCRHPRGRLLVWPLRYSKIEMRQIWRRRLAGILLLRVPGG